MIDPFEQILIELRALRAEIKQSGAHAVACKRKVAAALMGIGTTKLDQLIKRGEISTAQDRTLIPLSEVHRYCAPRPVTGKVARERRVQSDGQSDAALADLKARIRRKGT